jgi:hypothetical protein
MFETMQISIDIYILADALNLITFEWIAILRVCRMIATHRSSRPTATLERFIVSRGS